MRTLSETGFTHSCITSRLHHQKLLKEVLQVGEMWQKANDDEKAPYIAMSNQDKQRYLAELEAYNYRYYRQ